MKIKKVAEKKAAMAMKCGHFMQQSADFAQFLAVNCANYLRSMVT